MRKFILTSILALASAAAAVGAAPGTIQNTGLFEFTDVDNTTSSVTASANITVVQVYDPSVGADGSVSAVGQTQYALPGDTATLTYTVSNLGNGPDSFNLAVTDPQTGLPVPATIYLDNGDGVFGPGDTAVTSLSNLPADASATVFVQYTVPTTAAGSQVTLLNLTATSAGDNTQTDSNNVGAITAINIVSFTLDSNNNVSTTPGAPVSATHTLTNTGNAAIDPTTLVSSTALTDANSASGTLTYVVKNNGTGTTSSSSTSLAAALQEAGSLSTGQTYTITATYTPATTAQNGNVYSNVITLSSNLTDTATLDNRVELAQAVSDTDTITVQRGVASVSKTVDNCGADATCAAPTLNATEAKPGDYLRYTVKVINTGTAAMKFPTLRDFVPVNTVFSSVTGSSTQAGSVLFSADRTAWNVAAPTALATSTSATSGPFVYVGLNSNGDSKVDASDQLEAGQTLTLTLIVKVRDTGNS